MHRIMTILAALAGYLVGSWNPAITLSKAIYHKDIRTCGSGNPGFTNFKRTFGNRYAWWVLALDLTKGAAVTLIFATILENYGNIWSDPTQWVRGAAYTGLFVLLGHAYPVWYQFHGGKGFLVTLSVLWVMDWRVGLFATVVMVVLLLTTKYMSLSTVTALLVSPILLWLMGTDGVAVGILAVMVVFVALRHKENFKRLRNGTEAKFVLRK